MCVVILINNKLAKTIITFVNCFFVVELRNDFVGRFTAMRAKNNAKYFFKFFNINHKFTPVFVNRESNYRSIGVGSQCLLAPQLNLVRKGK